MATVYTRNVVHHLTMKIGIYNIFTVFWFLLILGGGGTIIYLAAPKLLDSGIIFIAKIFIALLALVVFGIMIFLLFKFQILITTTTKIYSFYPFKFKYTTIDKNSIQNINWFNWELKGILYKSIKIRSTEKSEIEFSDFEFQNFNQLESAVSQNTQNNQERIEVIKEQANNNFKLAIFSALLYFVASVVIFGLIITNDKIHWISITFILIGLLFSFIEAKKTFKYQRIKKTVYNNSYTQ